MAAVPRHPRVELFERLLAQRIETPLRVRAHLHDARVRKDAQMPGDAGLVDVHALDEIAHSALARPDCLDQTKSGRIRKGMEDLNLL